MTEDNKELIIGLSNHLTNQKETDLQSLIIQ